MTSIHESLLMIIACQLAGLWLVYYYRGRLPFAPLIARFILVSFGVSLAALGYVATTRTSQFYSVFGAFLIVVGIQISLGVLGFKSDLIGTREPGLPTSAVLEPQPLALDHIEDVFPLFVRLDYNLGAHPEVLLSILSLVHIEELRPGVQEAVTLIEKMKIRSLYSREILDVDRDRLTALLAELRARILVSLNMRQRQVLFPMMQSARSDDARSQDRNESGGAPTKRQTERRQRV